MRWSLWLLLLLSTAVRAEIYHYVDARGHKVYVDRLSEVPARYRSQVEKVQELPAISRQEPVDPQLEQAKLTRQKIAGLLAKIDKSLKTLETPVRIAGNRVLVPVTAVYGNRQIDAQMMLDTGASGTVFHRQVLAALNSATYAAGKAKVAGGQSIDVRAINLDGIDIGPFKIGSTRAMVIDHVGTADYDGLLGMDFLRQVRYRVDYDRKLIIWNPDQYQSLLDQRKRLKEQDAQLRSSVSELKH